MKVKANGISVNYEIKGKGTNLVLIHGAGDNLNMWYHQVPAFSKNYRVIAYDVRGSGQADSPAGAYSIPLFMDDAYELMKALKVSSAIFMGYSMGGRVALEMAIKHPEMVKALILANSGVGLAPPTKESAERRRAMLEPLEKKDMAAFAEFMTNSAFSPGFKTRNPTEFERYRQVKAQNRLDGMVRLFQSLGAAASPPDLSKVKCPVLLIVGEHDLFMGVEQGRETQKALAGSKLVVLPTGHAAAIELPEGFNAAVAGFLSGISG